MIHTEIFEISNCNEYLCIEDTLKAVNDFIKETQIEKNDIIEYRTENWSEETDSISYYFCKVVLSLWK